MFNNIRAFMKAAGGSPDNIGIMTVFLKENSYRDSINKEWVKMFPDAESRPARHTTPLTDAGDTLVQCDVTAVF